MRGFKIFMESNELVSLINQLESNYDSTPRLVIADWMDEHGDPDLANMIRNKVAWDSNRDNHKAREAYVYYKTRVLAKIDPQKMIVDEIHWELKPKDKPRIGVRAHGFTYIGTGENVNLEELSEPILKGLIYLTVNRTRIFGTEQLFDFVKLAYDIKNDIEFRKSPEIILRKLKGIEIALSHGVDHESYKLFKNEIMRLATLLGMWRDRVNDENVTKEVNKFIEIISQAYRKIPNVI